MSDQVWVDKYRPESLDEIVGHDTVVVRMQSFVDDPEMPNLMFAGRQGIGKTAIVQAFAKEKYGSNWSQRLLELNASDERGIDTVRNQIKDFARTGSGQYDFKLIFLDEADQLTRDAQPALRRTMEDYSDTTRFILSCNYPGQIIDPIQSRCGIYRLTPLTDEQVTEVLERVIDGEDLDVDDGAVDEIARVSRGDARSAIHTLHATVLDDELTAEDAHQMLGVVDYDRIDAIVDQAIEGDFDEAMSELDEKVLKQGPTIDSVIETFVQVIKRKDALPPDAKVKALDALGEADERLRAGANPHVQFHALLSNLLLARASSTGGYDNG